MNIMVFSGNRSDYFLLKQVILRLVEAKANLRKEVNITCLFGGIYSDTMSLQWREAEIESLRNIGVRIYDGTEIVEKSKNSLAEQISLSLSQFSSYFNERKAHKNILVLLGDRCETFGAAIAAGSNSIPVIHLCGGESTLGAMDDWMRHGITKIASAHFVTNYRYKERLVKMGEQPTSVFDYGHPLADLLDVSNLPDKRTLTQRFPFLIGKKIVTVTVHSETLSATPLLAFEVIEQFIKKHHEFYYVITSSNNDEQGDEINSRWKILERDMSNVTYFETLGSLGYLAMLKHSEFAIGNSSSLLIDTQATKTPAILVGNRQLGRMVPSGTLHVQYGMLDLETALSAIILNKSAFSFDSEYLRRGASRLIAEKVLEIGATLKSYKEFYDV